MASSSSIALRSSLAHQSESKALISLSQHLGISPPEELPPGLRNPDMKHAVMAECRSEFLQRAVSALAKFMDEATAPKKAGRTDGNK